MVQGDDHIDDEEYSRQLTQKTAKELKVMIKEKGTVTKKTLKKDLVAALCDHRRT